MKALRALVAAVALLVLVPSLGSQQLPLRISFVDVGQGDGVLIQSPSGQNVVVDGGENPSRMREYLEGVGVAQVGLVIASHNHADRIGGLAEVIRRFAPTFYMDNGVPATTQTYARLLQVVTETGSQLVEPTTRRINLGDVSLTVVPPPGLPEWDHNDEVWDSTPIEAKVGLVDGARSGCAAAEGELSHRRPRRRAPAGIQTVPGLRGMIRKATPTKTL